METLGSKTSPGSCFVCNRVSVAGTYGALHNQISYSVSPEYFTEFKFHQFSIPRTVPNRIGAAIVGWRASWWMGIVIGVFLIPYGLTIAGAKNSFSTVIRVFGIVASTTLFVGVTALSASFLTLDSDSVGELSRYDNEIVDDIAFVRAGTMHNFSYLGGMVGIVTGAFATWWFKCKLVAEKRSEQKPMARSAEYFNE